MAVQPSLLTAQRWLISSLMMMSSSPERQCGADPSTTALMWVKQKKWGLILERSPHTPRFDTVGSPQWRDKMMTNHFTCCFLRLIIVNYSVFEVSISFVVSPSFSLEFSFVVGSSFLVLSSPTRCCTYFYGTGPALVIRCFFCSSIN